MNECFIVVHRNYAEGLDAYGFRSEEVARMSVNNDVDTVIKSLTEEGYAPTVHRLDQDNVEVCALDGNIYYEWSIILSDIQ